jgi:hypothetical protein
MTEVHASKIPRFRKLNAGIIKNMPTSTPSPSERIDKLIAKLSDWRGEMLAQVRSIIHEAEPEIIEEWKWMGSPCWSCEGLICVGNAHKDKVKVTFAQGASLADPKKTFNAGLGGNRWRAIDWYEGDRIDAEALKDLIRAAVTHNRAGRKEKRPTGAGAKKTKARK